jgi:hypothetical protein|tara:strand:- start:78 stop:755 length:678 start_codon:yes stop_codon:yes gene_type:complete
MDFNQKRLALLAGIGNVNDRHDIVNEQVAQLNESIEAKQINESEEEVRKAVRRAIRKMMSEGALNLDEAHHDDDVDEITGGSVRVMEEEGEEPPSEKDLELMRKSLKAAEAEAERRKQRKVNEELDDEEMDEADDYGTESFDPNAVPPSDVHEGEDTHMSHPMNEEDMEEVSLYEMEDGSMHMEMGGVRYALQELEEIKIPDDATDASVGDDGDVEFHKQLEETE